MIFDNFNENQVSEQSVNPRACRNLWVAVLTENFRVAFQSRANDSALDIQASRNWFGTKDFATVCELAGLEPSCVWRGVQPYLAAVRGVA